MASTSSPASTPTVLSPKLPSASRPSTATSLPLSQTSSTIASHVDPDAERLADEDADSIISEFHREAYGPKEGEKGWDEFEVRLEANDPEDPRNWSRTRRWYITLLGGLLVLNAYVCSILRYVALG